LLRAACAKGTQTAVRAELRLTGASAVDPKTIQCCTAAKQVVTAYAPRLALPGYFFDKRFAAFPEERI
jgi:hypothetical protein